MAWKFYDTNGNLKTTGSGAGNLDNLSDVALIAAAEGDILRRNATQFVNTPLGDYVFLESEHLAASAGAADAGKPVKLDAAGQLDASLINDANIDHGSLGGLTDDDHPNYVWLAPAADTRNVIQPGAATVKGLVLKGAASQSDNLLEFQDSTGAQFAAMSPTQFFAPAGSTLLAGLSFNGNTTTGIGVNGNQMSIFHGGTVGLVIRPPDANIRIGSGWALGWSVVSDNNGGADTAISREAAGVVRIGSPATGRQALYLGAGAAGTVALRVQAAASQTANLQQWLNSSAAVLALVNKDGGFVFNEQGLDVDCRVEGDTDANLFYTDASVDRVGIGTSSPTAKLDISADVLRLRTAKTPASASDTGNAGDICWDTNYLYICTATDTWKRAALATW